jgi:hypothetical protein
MHAHARSHAVCAQTATKHRAAFLLDEVVDDVPGFEVRTKRAENK